MLDKILVILFLSGWFTKTRTQKIKAVFTFVIILIIAGVLTMKILDVTTLIMRYLTGG